LIVTTPAAKLTSPRGPQLAKHPIGVNRREARGVGQVRLGYRKREAVAVAFRAKFGPYENAQRRNFAAVCGHRSPLGHCGLPPGFKDCTVDEMALQVEVIIDPTVHRANF
jgi:hypothetical protein